jgi:enoyl-CoA hydratase
MTDDFACLSLSIDGAIAHIRLTRAEVNNRFDEALHGEFPRALAALRERDDIAALVLSAEGRHFSAGGDMHMMLRANRDAAMRERLVREGIGIVEGLLSLPFPAIAAVQGGAIGLGATVIGCCDIVVAARDARIADPHVVLGLVAGDGGIMGWSQSIGIARAKRYLLTGDRISGEDAHAMGMVSDLVDSAEEVLPAAQAIAAQIAALPRGGVRGTKRAFARLSRDLYAGAFELSFAYEMDTLAGDEVRTTVLAALEPREKAG